MYARAIACLFVGLLTTPALAAATRDDLLTGYSLTSWTDDAGRALGAVHAIVQDGEGYLWIGAESGTRDERAMDILVPLVHRDHDDPGRRLDLLDAPERVDPARLAEPQVHQRNVRLMQRELRHRFVGRIGERHELDVGSRSMMSAMPSRTTRWSSTQRTWMGGVTDRFRP